MVKRSLPRSGSYDLERFIFSFVHGSTCVYRYMPVFLWKERMKRMGIDPYKELLKLVAERQNDDTDDVEV